MSPSHTQVSLHRCPYYRTAEQDLWGRLLDVSSPAETKYWSSLANVAVDSSTCDSTFVQVGMWQMTRLHQLVSAMPWLQ